MSNRIYLVTDSSGQSAPRLVNASSQARAISHVVGKRFRAEVAKVAEALTLQAKGVQVEEAGITVEEGQ